MAAIEPGEMLVTRGPAFKPPHPGEDLREDVLPALGMSRAAFARHLGISRNTLYKLLNEEQPVTLDIALRLAKALGGSARLWLALQAAHDIWVAERENKVKGVTPIKWKGKDAA
jgi:addiction module HigA family antidote